METTLRFNGSLWCNVDIALRTLDGIYGQVTTPLGLAVIEWYILRALYEKDRQHASELAKVVGRAATSFTPILDKLQRKGFIERQPDPMDRRAVYIQLLDKGRALQAQVEASAHDVDARLQQLMSKRDWQAVQRVLARLQTLALN